MNNSYISNGQNTSGYVNRPKSKFIKTKAKVDSNLSYFSAKSFTQQKTSGRKLGWDDYFKSQTKKDDPKEIGNFNYAQKGTRNDFQSQAKVQLLAQSTKVQEGPINYTSHKMQSRVFNFTEGERCQDMDHSVLIQKKSASIYKPHTLNKP